MNKLFIFWIVANITGFNQPMEFRDTVNFDQCVNSIAGLIDHKILAAIQIIIHAGRSKDTNRRQQIQHIQPISRHRPPPTVAILRIRHHIPQVIEQHAGEAFSNTQIRNPSKFYGPIIPELELYTVPVRASFTVPLTGFIVNTDHNLAFRTADHNRAALAGKHGFPIIGAGNKILVLGIVDNLHHIQNTGMIIESNIQTRDLRLRLYDPGKQLVPADRRKGFKSAAALAGHFTPDTHIITAVIVDRNRTEILAITITVRAFDDLPGASLKTQHADHIVRGKNFRCKRKPVIKDYVLLQDIHNLPPFCCVL